MYETYSEEVMENFMHPRNMGEIKEKDLKKGESLAVGKVGNPVCGDVMQIFVKIKISQIVLETGALTLARRFATLTEENYHAGFGNAQRFI